jgi:hypothetical protein
LSASLASCDANGNDSAVNRIGYITISGGIKLAYDLTLPAASSGSLPSCADIAGEPC